tara:strand:- start:1139 stop:1480 length:342 start_codon:yes stop_codon:yes gene_type:complete
MFSSFSNTNSEISTQKSNNSDNSDKEVTDKKVEKFVITYNGIPNKIADSEHECKELMWDIAYIYSVQEEDRLSDYNVRIYETNNKIIVTKQYKFFIFSYEEDILILEHYKIDS